MFFYMRPAANPPGAAGPAPDPSATMPADTRTLILTAEAMARAGVSVAPVTPSTEGTAIRVPGIIEPDAYRTVDVTPIVSGTVLSVSAALGDLISQGTVVARLRSPELTDEVRRWLTGKANLDAVSRRLERTRQLVKIGAASKEEAETDQSDFVRSSTDLETARARLLRLGLTDLRLAAIAAGEAAPETIDVRAPAAGVVLRRTANVGQNVGPADSLITLASVRSVWAVADVFERDLGQVRLGQRVTLTTDAFPGRTWTGRVTYVDPQLARETRTARARVEVDNPDAALRIGMFVALTISSASVSARVMVPMTAIQTLGAVFVVYIEGAQPNQFVERAVAVGASVGDQVEIRSGLSPGEKVVVAGSFFLRSERDRLGWPPPR
jgi:cobalt-zinc-cadmium efflux system membrane fusion protein